MKKLILSLALCCAATNFFAQNADPAQLVNEGKAALESKNYQVAFTKFSTYLTQTNNQDSVIAFNCGVCADKIKKPAEALKYFDIAVQKKYNLANAYIGKARYGPTGLHPGGNTKSVLGISTSHLSQIIQLKHNYHHN